jgi:hypothetical protein
LASALGVFSAQSYPATRNASDQLASEPEADLFDRLRAAESIGRPPGGDRLLRSIERRNGRSLKPRQRGPKPEGDSERGGCTHAATRLGIRQARDAFRRVAQRHQRFPARQYGRIGKRLSQGYQI